MSSIMKLWQFAVNQFLNGTKANYKKTLILSTAHDAYLKQMTVDFPGDPDWTTLYNRYHPLHLDYKAAYNAWVASGGSLKSKTLSLKVLFKLIPAKLDLWIAQIIPFFIIFVFLYNAILRIKTLRPCDKFLAFR